MLVTRNYDRTRAVTYARRWALSRNPLYFDYTGIGGNCTNFVSQCVYAGSCTMNYTPVFGWYYLSPAERTAAWTGVTFFYNFLTGNDNVGPFGREVSENELLPGDVIQLGRNDTGFYHTLLFLDRQEGELLVAAQSDDALDRPLSTYTYDYARFLRIDGVRLDIPNTEDCFASLLSGVAIVPNAATLPPPPEDTEAPEGTPPTPPPMQEEAEEPAAPEEEAPPAEEPVPPASEEAPSEMTEEDTPSEEI